MKFDLSFFKNIYLFIYLPIYLFILAALGLGCGTWDLLVAGTWTS